MPPHVQPVPPSHVLCFPIRQQYRSPAFLGQRMMATWVTCIAPRAQIWMVVPKWAFLRTLLASTFTCRSRLMGNLSVRGATVFIIWVGCCLRHVSHITTNIFRVERRARSPCVYFKEIYIVSYSNPPITKCTPSPLHSRPFPSGRGGHRHMHIWGAISRAHGGGGGHLGLRRVASVWHKGRGILGTQTTYHQENCPPALSTVRGLESTLVPIKCPMVVRFNGVPGLIDELPKGGAEVSGGGAEPVPNLKNSIHLHTQFPLVSGKTFCCFRHPPAEAQGHIGQSLADITGNSARLEICRRTWRL